MSEKPKYQPAERERAVLRKQAERREAETPALRVEVLHKGATLLVDHPDATAATLPRMPPVEAPTNGGDRGGLFKQGGIGGPGRPRGSTNRNSGDLRQMIMNAAVRTGHIGHDKDGKRIATGEGGCEGYLGWLAINEPRTFAAMLIRNMPYYISADVAHRIMTTEQVEAEFKRLGLPMDIIKRLQRTPARLDDDEVENPYTPKTVDVTPEGGTGNDTAK